MVGRPRHQQRRRPASDGRPLVIDLLVEPSLHSLEQIAIDNGRLLAGKNLTLEHHLAEVEPVAQKVGQGTAGEGDAAHRLTCFQGTHLGDDTALAEVGHQEVEAAELQIAREMVRTRSASASLTMILRSLVS
jgi:hypothetical protein